MFVPPPGVAPTTLPYFMRFEEPRDCSFLVARDLAESSPLGNRLTSSGHFLSDLLVESCSGTKSEIFLLRKEWLNAFFVKGGAPAPNQRMPHNVCCKAFDHKSLANTRFAVVLRCTALHITASLALGSYKSKPFQAYRARDKTGDVKTSTEMELSENEQ